MDTSSRMDVYTRDRSEITPRQRRRLIKKAGRDPLATIVRDEGMGFSPARQGERILLGCERAAQPVSGIPATGIRRGHHAVGAWTARP